MANQLIGSVTVQPPVVQPGESVLVQVCDVNGKPYTADSDVAVTLQGVEVASRYYQFSTPGVYSIAARASKGGVDELCVVTVNVEGASLQYHRSLGDSPQTAMPIIQASLKLGNPYQAAFTLCTPNSLKSILAQQSSGATLDDGAASRSLSAPSSDSVSSRPAIAGVRPAVVTAPSKEYSTFAAALTAAAATTGSGAGGGEPPILINATPMATSYIWAFGDGSSVTTQTPTVTHDYFPAVNSQKVIHAFDVSCTVVHDSITVTRTVVLASAYGVSKRLGSITPHFEADEYAVFQDVGFSASMIVHNIESEPITLTRMAVVPVSDDPTIDAPSPRFSLMETPISIPANSSAGLGVYVTADQLGAAGPKVSGFRVWYLGNTSAPALPRTRTILPAAAAEIIARPIVVGTVLRPPVVEPIKVVAPAINVRLAHTFRIRLTDSGRIPALPKVSIDHAALLANVAAIASNPKSAVSLAGTQVVDAATSTVAIPLGTLTPAIAVQSQVRAAIQAGFTTAFVAAPSTGSSIPGIRAITPPLPGPPPADPTIAAGNICDPDNIQDADAAAAKAAHLACQLTNETQQVLIPGAFQNALKGDIILSPGEDSADNLIGSLLRSLRPAQYHSHSGLMTRNFFEITHCTASPERLTSDNNLRTGGADGIQPDVLQFGWPGSITQSIDAAISGERWNAPEDPSGKTSYLVHGFNPEPLGIQDGSNGSVLVYPMVVKPLPENEADVRPSLRQAADLARARGATVDGNGNLVRKGGCYYSFYAYTKPEISAGFTSPAPDSAGWAAGLSPAVCSSFIWMSMKAAGLPLLGSNAVATNSELSASALAAGAQLGATTLDGLFYYPQPERQTAAQILNSILINEADQHEGFAQYIPVIGPAISKGIADQVLNMFAFNDPDEFGSDEWTTSGDANAVSPDNIMWWNPPYFGYAEPVQYLPAHTETYVVSRWQPVTVVGTVSGTVTRQDSGVAVAGARVSLNDSLTATTDANGAFAIADVAAGSYNLKALATVTAGNAQVEMGNGPAGPAGPGQAITTTADSPNLAGLNVVLQGAPDRYRRLDLQFQWQSGHSDWNIGHDQGVRYEGPNTASIALVPGSNTGSYSYTYDYNSQGLFRCRYDFTAALLEDLSIQVSLTGRMFNDGSSDELVEYTINFNVPKDGQNAGWRVSLDHQGPTYENGPAVITGTATNVQLTN